MASINWIVTDISNTVGVPNNVGVIEGIKNTILHVRNEQIRRHYDNHKYIDKTLQNRIPIQLIDVPDGDIPVGLGGMIIKKSSVPVPRPTRLANNVPFTRVSTTGAETNVEIAFVKETQVRYMLKQPYFCSPMYDYINGIVYVYPNPKAGDKNDFNVIQIEAAFQWNMKIIEDLFYKTDMLYDLYNDDDFIPDDLVPEMRIRATQIAINANRQYETNENENKVVE
jgi:hypothetical protein